MSIQGVHLLPSRFALPIRSRRYGRGRLLCPLAMAIAVAALAPVADSVSANAPPVAKTVRCTQAPLAPGYDAGPVAVDPRGAEVELTGEVAPGFLGVYYDGRAVWVPAQYLTLGARPGIDTKVSVTDTPLLGAPMRGASVLEIIQEGQAVVLTEASVDGFDAVSYDGAGGWINERDLSR